MWSAGTAAGIIAGCQSAMLIADGPAARRAGVPTAAGSHAITIAGNVGRDVGDSVMEMQAAVSYWRPWGGTVGRRLARLVSPVVFWTVFCVSLYVCARARAHVMRALYYMYKHAGFDEPFTLILNDF